MKRHILINVNKLLSILIKLFIISSLFFPYVTKLSYRNVVFILSNFFVILSILVLFIKKTKTKENIGFIFIFLMLLTIYNIVCGIYNILYHHYYIEQVNKNISIIFFILLMVKIDKKFIDDYNIVKFLIKCIIISVCISCILYLFNIEGLFFENATFMARKQGLFEGNRLSWVYGHKSTYALMLLLYMSLVLKFEDVFDKKSRFYMTLGLLIIAIILTATATALILMVILLTINLISKINFKSQRIVKILGITLLFFISIFIGLFVINIISRERDITTIGNRTYIYNAAWRYLSQHKNGIGKAFGNIYITHEVGKVENFHNIFLNEMLRFSVPVGLLYMILMIVCMLYCIKKGRLYSIAIWICCFILFFMDYCLKTEQLSIFFFFIYFICIYKNDNFYEKLVKSKKLKKR